MTTLFEWLRLKKNKIRIWLLSIPAIGRMFGRTIKKIEIKDPKSGKTHEIVTEQYEEKSCAHNEIREVAPMIWQCMKCEGVYFFLMYKVMATKPELVDFTEKLSTHFNLHEGDQDK